MITASISDIQKELSSLSPKQVSELCLRLARFKKENKELLSYLLFEAGNEESFIKAVKDEADILFGEINKSNLYFAKKSLRKILRNINKYIRYSGKKNTEAELRIFYLLKLKESGIPFANSPVLVNLYNNQLKKIEGCISGMHEDLQLDFRLQFDRLNKELSGNKS